MTPSVTSLASPPLRAPASRPPSRVRVVRQDSPQERAAERSAEQFVRSGTVGPVAATRAGPAGRGAGAVVHRSQGPAPSHEGGTAAPESVDRTLAASGEPLPLPLRLDMERAFGADFAHVRVHTDPMATRSTRELGATAWASGHHLAFDSGRYAPATLDGRRLVAHELAHVVQQSHGTAAGTVQCNAPEGSAAARFGQWYDHKKWGVYRAMIAGLKGTKNRSMNLLRAQVHQLPASFQEPVLTVLGIADFVIDLDIALVLAIIGLAVGFVEGLVGLVTGLVRILGGLIQMLGHWVLSLFGKPEAYVADARALAAAIQNMPSGMKRLIDDWLARYQRATLEEQVLMGGELVGQIEAFIATFALGGAKAGQAVTVSVEVGGGGIRLGSEAALEGARVVAVTVPKVVPKTAAQAAVVASHMTMIGGPGGPGGGGGSTGPAPSADELAKGPRSTGEAVDELDKTANRGSGASDPTHSQYAAQAGTQIERATLQQYLATLSSKWAVWAGRESWPPWLRKVFPRGGPDAVALNEAEKRILVVDSAPGPGSLVDVRPGMGRGAPAGSRTGAEADLVRAGDDGRMLHIEKTVDDARRIADNLPAELSGFQVEVREVYWGAPGKTSSKLIRVK